MSEIGEAIGTAVEGGLFAKAVGGKRGALTDKDGKPLERGHFAEGACLNCGTELIGAHCHACGQKAHLHRTLAAFAHDLLHGALHFDGKTWRTLPKLAFKPGELTRRYIEGERARFVSPMALFLFSIFLMFAVFQLAGISTPTDFDPPSGEDVSVGLERKLAALETDIAQAEKRLDAGGLTDAERTQLEQELARDRSEFDQLDPLQNLPFFRSSKEEPAQADGDILTEEEVLAIDEDNGARMTVSPSGVRWIDSALKKWRDQPALMLYKLQTNFYKFSWLLIPLSIPFVWLLFVWKRRFRAYDHAVFVTYSLAFMSLLLVTLSLLLVAGVEAGWIFTIFATIAPLHIYKQLRGAYSLSRFSATWRLIMLLWFITIILTLFLQVLLLLGAF